MKTPSQRLLVIADDLTGAADAGAAAKQSKPGADCLVVPWRGTSADHRAADAWHRVDEAHKADILCLSTNSRNVDPAEASARVRAAVSWSRGRGFRLFKKVDSLLRGQVSAELATFMRESPSYACLFAPALPGQGRTTSDGVQYHHGQPVAESAARLDAHAPPPSSRLQLIAPAGVPVHHLGISEVRANSLTEQLAEYTALGGLIVADSLTAEDLMALRDSALEIEGLDMAGSSGLLAPRHAVPSSDWAVGHRPTIVVSASRRTEVQIQCDALSQRLAESSRIVIHPTHCPTPRELATELEKGIRKGGLCVVTVTPSVPLAAAAGDRREVAEVLLNTLSESVCMTIPAVLGRALVVLIGGDLSQSVCQLWSVDSFAVIGTALEGGSVCAVMDRDDLADVCVIMRSGGFGSADALIELAKTDYLDNVEGVSLA